MGDAADDLIDDGMRAMLEGDDMRDDEVVRIENVTCKVETDKALLCVVEGEEVWVPKSQVTDDSEVYEKDGDGTLVVTLWFAEQRGWA